MMRMPWQRRPRVEDPEQRAAAERANAEWLAAARRMRQVLLEVDHTVAADQGDDEEP